MKNIDKDFLTMEKCRMDLLFNSRGNWPFHLLMAITLALTAGLLHMTGALGFPGEEELHRFLPLLWLIPAGYSVGAGIYILRKWLWITKTQFTVAEDVLCRGEAIMMRPRGRGRYFREWTLSHWEFQFAEHGLYKTTMSHATWSKKGNRMNCNALGRSSEPGDKFYLILDPPAKEGQEPKILLAYPCKYFEWKDSRA